MNDTTTGQASGAVARFTYDGRIGELYVIFIKNILLTIVTLGIYRFWGKTRVRRYLWSHTALFGDRFEYTGTGWELFKGFLVALLLFVVGLAAVIGLAVLLEGSIIQSLILLIVYVGVVLLLFIGQYTALRYRLTRSQWRGIRGGLSGSAWKFGWLSLGWTVLTILTLGILTPVAFMRRLSYRLNNAYFGTARMSFVGKAGPIFGRFLAIFLLSIAGGAAVFAVLYFAGALEGIAEALAATTPESTNPQEAVIVAVVILLYIALFISGLLLLPLTCWYLAFLYNYLLGSSSLATLQFRGTVRTWSMFGYLVVNFLIMLFTLGLGFPWVLHRVMRFIAANVEVHGVLDPETIRQSQLASPSRGEGLLEVLDPTAI